MVVAVYPNALAKRTRVLSHPMRMEILRLLIARRPQPCGVSALIDLLMTETGKVASQPNVSHCLRDLKKIGLVEKRGAGYVALPSELSRLMGDLMNYTGITQGNSVEYEEPGEN